MSGYFASIAPIKYKGPETTDPLAFRYYDKDRIVLGKRMEEQLRFAVCYWHNFSWNGFDLFGSEGTFERPWQGARDSIEAAKIKAGEAFDFFTKLGVPFYTFHDRDVAPEGSSPQESLSNLRYMTEILGQHQERTGVGVLFGTANLFSHRCYMSGAATNPDPEVFALAAHQVKAAMDATFALGGENYVLWGGREGYDTLLNTDIGQELDQLGRFLTLVVEYKHKIGFKGNILVEPKPREPLKHQYDFDTATVYGFLCRFGLEKEVKVNIEANHATLSGHSFEHEIALAKSLDIFGSIDMNRGDPQLGWDTDQFPNNTQELLQALYTIFKAGGFTKGGLNFDAKIRRQSIEPEDMFYAHIGAMDVCARTLLAVERIISDGTLPRILDERYAGWKKPFGQKILSGQTTLTQLAQHAEIKASSSLPASGRQEYLENLINRFL